MNLEFIHMDGPFSDCTSRYKVDFDGEPTLKEFIEYILNDYSINSRNNWGFIEVATKDRSFVGKPIIAYNRGKWQYEEPWCDPAFSDEFLRANKDKRIEIINASGGWSRMDYILILEE